MQTYADAQCESVAIAVRKIQSVLRSNLERYEVLDAIWGLRDQTSRLLDYASDHPEEAFHALRDDFPELVQSVFDVLTITGKLGIDQIPAVKESCDAIVTFLVHLEDFHPSIAKSAAAL